MGFDVRRSQTHEKGFGSGVLDGRLNSTLDHNPVMYKTVQCSVH